MSSEILKLQIIQAGRKAVEQLIKVAKEDIIKPDPEDDIAADKLKNAAATKKLAIFDAFDILNKIDAEQENINISKKNGDKIQSKQGFAERRSK
jgi:ASC-1-like (ASCH) protein